MRLVDDGFDIGIRKSCLDAIDEVEAKGGRPYAIPAGASVHKLGGLGYVGFAEEVRAQESELGFAFDYIIVCTVTGSTQAGMVVGFAKDGRAAPRHRRRRLVHAGADEGASAGNRAKYGGAGRAWPATLSRTTSCSSRITPIPLRRAVGGDQRGDPPRRAPRRHDHRPRLRGQVDAGHDRPGQQGLFPQGSKVLYAHLGGAPALNGYGYAFRNG